MSNDHRRHGSDVMGSTSPPGRCGPPSPTSPRGLQGHERVGLRRERRGRADEGAHRHRDRRRAAVRRMHRLHARGAAKRGATPEQVAEAIQGGDRVAAGGPATVYGPRAYAAFLEFHEKHAPRE